MVVINPQAAAGRAERAGSATLIDDAATSRAHRTHLVRAFFSTVIAVVWQRRAGAKSLPAPWREIAIERPQSQVIAAAGSGATAATVEAFERFFQQHNAEIVGYLWRMTCDEQAAYDLTQEVFVRAWSHFAEVSGFERPRAWLFRVATNLALNHIRQRTAWGRLTSPISSLLSPGGEAVPTEPSGTAPAITSADHAAAIAERDAIREALLALKSGYRAALVLQAVYGMTCAEIAEALGVSLSGAKTRLARGRARFRAQYLRNERDAEDDLQQDDKEDDA